MTDEQQEPVAEELPLEVTLTDALPADVVVRNAAKREIDVRLAPFGSVINTTTGPEVIEPGAFRNIDPKGVLLMGLEHEVHLGLGQHGQLVPTRRPAGKALRIWEDDKAGYATFRVAKTASGDEILALAEDEVVGGVSIEMGGNARTRTETRSGRRTRLVEWSDLRGVSPTYRPAYVEAQVLAVRSQEEEAPVATEDKAPEAGATAVEEKTSDGPRIEDVRQVRSAHDETLIAGLSQRFDTTFDKVLERLEKIEERGRMGFELPAATPKLEKVSMGKWMDVALKLLSGERVPQEQFRTVEDVITTDNAGVVPDAYVNELIGVIDPSRPFMASTRKLETPDSGMTISIPKLTQRPEVGRQMTEKTELASEHTIITSEEFGVQTYGGVGDISLQLLKRASRSFKALYLELLAEAYAIETDDAAVAALISAINDGGPEPATALNPASLNLGSSFIASFDAIRRPPDTIWLSTKAIGEFIDAKATTTNQPLYPGLTPSAEAGGGITGTVSGLRAVHVPALDDKGAYAIVGPSRGFAWAEDGTYTLEVDVPARAGRDVALVGMVWFAPYYPAAFSLFNVAS